MARGSRFVLRTQVNTHHGVGRCSAACVCKQMNSARACTSDLRRLYRVYGALGEKVEALFQIIPTLSANQRSSLIKACQAQTLPPPDPSNTLYNLTSNILSHDTLLSYSYKGHTHSVPARALLLGLVDDHALSGLVLDLARSLPMELSMVDDLKMGSWFKEIAAVEHSRPDGFIDFGPIFDWSRRNEPLHPLLPPNPYMCTHFYTAISRWKQWSSSVVHYPRANDKFMSHDTRKHFEDLTGREVDGFTQRDYLAFEARTGIRLGGVVEMRQRWYKSGFKPRTYYAQGGVYGTTYCLQDLFSKLVNCSPITHHVTRLRPSRLYLHPGQHFRIYDLASFTSLMWSQRDFIRDLADFCRGTPVTLMTAGDGLICRDLGDVLDEYNEVCNNYCAVSYQRCPFVEVNHHTYQHVAGMLGVFGNLMTCTLPHGIIMSMFATDEDQLNCAGDDGIVPEAEGEEAAIREAINLIGVHEETKEFITTQSGCIHLKRPIYQLANKAYQRPMIIWPNVATLAEMLTNHEDPRYRRFGELQPRERLSLVGREMLRFLRSIFRSGFVDDETKWLAGDFCYRVTRLFEGVFDYSLMGGRLTQCGDMCFWPSIPRDLDDMKRDPWIHTVKSRFAGSCAVQYHLHLPWDGEVEKLGVGVEFWCNPDRHLSFLVNCGYLEVEPVIMSLVGEPALERLLADFPSLDPPVNMYKVIDEIPVKFHGY